MEKQLKPSQQNQIRCFCKTFIYTQQQPLYMNEKMKTKREEIEEMLESGKTAKQIWISTGYDRSYVWTVAGMYYRHREKEAEK